MPYKRTYVRRRKPVRRTYVKKKRNSRYKAGFKRLMTSNPFPNTKYFTMKYLSVPTLTSTGGPNTGLYTYRLNGLFDPDYTSSGSQPKFYDTLFGASGGSQPYQNYRVHAAKVTVRMNNGNSSGLSNGYCGIRVRDSNATVFSSSSDPSIWGETQYTKWKDIGSSGGNSQRRVFTQFIKIAKFYGVKDLSDNPDFSAIYSSLPATTCFLDVFYRSSDPTNNLSVNTTVEIKFYVQAFIANSVVQSF